MRCRICNSELEIYEELNCITTDVNSVYSSPCKQNVLTMNFYYCEKCRHGQIDDVLPDDFYKSYKLLNVDGNNNKAMSGSASLRIDYYKEVLNRLYDYGTKYSDNLNYLDIGCGTGTVLDIAETIFKKSGGVEPSESECQIAIERGHSVDNCFFNADYLRNKKNGDIHVVTAIQVFEHLADPVDAAKCMYELLCDGGVGYVDVPNGANLIGNKQFTDINSDHINYYSPESLARVFKEAGFKILSVGEECKGAYVAIYILKHEDNLGFSKSLKNEKGALSKLFKEYRKVGIYGCGMKGKAFIKVMGQQPDFTPTHVFDKNRNIEGMYVPNCNMPIEYPTQEKINDCDAIFITAIEHKTSIMDMLQEMKYKGNVLYLGDVND